MTGKDLSPKFMGPTEFLEALRNGTDGVWSIDAAIWLLGEHEVWLRSSKLREYAVSGIDEVGMIWAGLDHRCVVTAIDSGELGEWGEDLAILMIAVSLIGDYPISLRYTIDCISAENIALVAAAIIRADGFVGATVDTPHI